VSTVGTLKQLTGPNWPLLRSSLGWSLAASIAQAASYALLIPLLASIGTRPFESGRTNLLLMSLTVLVIAEGLLRRKELSFSFDSFALVIEELRLRLGRRLRTMPLELLQRKAAGDLASVIGSNVVDAVMAISAVATLVLQFVAVPAVLVVVIVVVDWRLAVVLLVTIPFAIPFVRRLRSVAGAGYARSTSSDGVAASRIVEYVQGLPVFRATGQVGPAATRLREAFEHQDEAQSSTQRGITTPSILAASVVQLGIVGLAALGSSLVVGGELSALALIAVVAAAVRFAEPLVTATAMTLAFEYAQAGVGRIADVLATPSLPAPPQPVVPPRADISFEHVTFSYVDSLRPVLRDLSLSVPERSLTALVGTSGSGKTTLARLVTRFADPQAGAVRIGGVDVRSIDPAVLTKLVSVVFQDVYLFDDTIAANIAMGRPGASPAEIVAAARSANCHDFVSALPQGYQTRVGEIGSSLSGGERQRISLARALLKDAPIVLLDEPTASLDAESETAVQSAIDRLVTEKTVLVIAHRLSTIAGADQIVVLEGGSVVEVGQHAPLLAANGRYAAMWRAQQSARGWRVSS
jgi:ATP-binding cassette, subfamily B, bacterial IrtB/YbtQ